MNEREFERIHKAIERGDPPHAAVLPTVYERTGRAEYRHDIFSRLLADGIVFLGDPIDDFIGNIIVAQMLFLQNERKKQDINLYINSPGGYVNAGLAIYDTMQFVNCDVATFCIGQASSIAALLLAAGTKGKRHALPNARMLLHQPAGGMFGTAVDIGIMAEEIVELRERINQILSYHTGQPVARIQEDSDRDFYLAAEEAQKYGLVDEVLGSLKDLHQEAATK